VRFRAALALVAGLICSTARGQFTTVYNVPPDMVPASIGEDTLLNVLEGGAIYGEFTSFGSVINVAGGAIYGEFTSSGSVINVAGGLIDNLRATNSTVVNVNSGGVTRLVFDASVLNLSGGVSGYSSVIRNGSVVNMSGGSLGRNSAAYDGSVVNLTAGSIGYGFEAHSGSVVNVLGGSGGGYFQVFDGSIVNLSGGTFGDVWLREGGSLNLSGGEFRIDENLIEELALVGESHRVELPTDSILSGTLADGTPFSYSSSALEDGTLSLNVAELPPIGPAVIIVPNDPVPVGIREGQTLIVDDGGVVEGLKAGWGSQIEILGGETSGIDAVGSRIKIRGGSHLAISAYVGTVVDISGGSFGSGANVYRDSVVNIDNGTFLNLRINDGGVANVRGGSIGRDNVRANLNIQPGGTLNMSGGTVGSRSEAMENSIVNLSGGSIGDEFHVGSDAVMHITGGSVGNEFHTDTGSQITISGGTIGDSFTVDNRTGDGGETLINIRGGAIGNDFLTYRNTIVNISGGTVGDRFSTGEGSGTSPGATVNLTGGAIGDGFYVEGFSVANVSGGAIGDRMTLLHGTILNLSGGAIGDHLTLLNDAVLNWSGGTFGGDFIAQYNSQVNIFGLEFLLDGVEIPDLVPGVPYPVTERDIELSGVLADGSPFSIPLDRQRGQGRTAIFDGATLTVTLLDLLPGDFNNDGIVNAADYIVWRNHEGTDHAMPNRGAGITGNVGQFDYETWRANFGRTVATIPSALRPPPSAFDNVPEPTSCVLWAIAAWVGFLPRRVATRPSVG
jgi:hypothetical protein